MPSPPQGVATLSALVSGLHDAPASVRQGGELDGLHLLLKLGGALAAIQRVDKC